MSELSHQQIIDAAGGFTDVAMAVVGNEQVQFDQETVPSPAYETVASIFQVPTEQGMFAVPDVPEAYVRLAAYPGLRVTIGVSVPKLSGETQEAYFPGIVLATAPGEQPHIGIMKAGPDIVLPGDLRQHLTRPLPDFQHNVLETIFGLHKPDVGNHGQQGAANVGETAHGVLVVATGSDQIGGVHGRVHEYVSNGLARTLTVPRAGVGVADVMVNGQIRPVREDALPMYAARSIYVSREHQLPLHRISDGTGLGIGELVVATTLAAVRSKAALGFPQPDLKAGMAAMVA